MLQKDLGLDSPDTRDMLQERLGRHLNEVEVAWYDGDYGKHGEEDQVGSFLFKPKDEGPKVSVGIRKRRNDGMLRIGHFSGSGNVREAAPEVFDTMENHFPPATVEEFRSAMIDFQAYRLILMEVEMRKDEGTHETTTFSDAAGNVIARITTRKGYPISHTSMVEAFMINEAKDRDQMIDPS